MDIEIDDQAETVIFRSGSQGEHHYRTGNLIGDSYRLLDLIGQGGMGVVYRVHHIILGKDYALKLLAPGQINSQSWRRFEVEGRALAKLNHANIVTIYNMGIDKEVCPYYVMDWLDGISLADRIKQMPLGEKEALQIFLQICAGLGSAHKNGIIHRDIKPANIMLTKGLAVSQVKIVDFGMARLQRDTTSQALTASGEIFGSPYYMSPEQAQGLEMDARSDVYSLGCSLFETLTGQVPFRGATAVKTMLMHHSTAPPSLASVVSSGVPFSNAIESIVSKCLQKEKSERYQSMEQMARDLQRLLDGKTSDQVSNSFSDSHEDWSPSQSQSQSYQSDSTNEEFESIQSESTILPARANRLLRLGIILSSGVLIFAAVVIIAGINFAAVKPAKIPSPLAKSEFSREVDVFLPETSVMNPQEQSVDESNRAEIQKMAQWPKISLGIKTIKGKKMRCFNFPPKFELAEIWLEGQVHQSALGEIAFGANEEVHLRFNQFLSECPDLLTKINPDDIYSFRIDDQASIPAVLTRISHWTRLHTLIVDGGEIADKDVALFDKLGSLTDLWLKRQSFKWPDFVRLKLLKRLTVLQIEDSKPLKGIIQHLPVMPRLQMLRLEGRGHDWIDSATVLALVKQPALKKLLLRTKETYQDANYTNPAASRALSIYTLKDSLSQVKQLQLVEFDEPDWGRARVIDFLNHVQGARGNSWARKYM